MIDDANITCNCVYIRYLATYNIYTDKSEVTMVEIQSRSSKFGSPARKQTKESQCDIAIVE